MALREQDDLPYRSPVPQQIAAPVRTRDEEQYSALKTVFGVLEDATVGLYNDFNAFNLAKDKPPEERAALLLHEVEVKQAVYDILVPLVERVAGAIATVDDDFRRRQNK